MNRVKTTAPVLEKLHNDWIDGLLAYEEQLQNIDTITAQLQSSVNDLHFQRELQQLRSEIVMRKNVVSVLCDEVIHLKKIFENSHKKQNITLDVLIENNRFREKIRKTEQSVFMLKYQVNKFLSIAS